MCSVKRHDRKTTNNAGIALVCCIEKTLKKKNTIPFHYPHLHSLHHMFLSYLICKQNFRDHDPGWLVVAHGRTCYSLP